MIRMKALRAFGVKSANEGHVRRGREFMVANDQRARDLEDEGLAFRLGSVTQPIPIKTMEPLVANKAAEAGPLDSAGGETGAANPPSLLLPDHPPPARRSRRSRGSRAS